MSCLQKFNRLFLLIVFSLAFLSLSTQEKHFIYLQTENNQPFYVKLNNNILSSSSAGYIILPNLQVGDQTFFIGFPKSNKPEQKFKVNVGNANKGFLIKNFDENDYALFDLQSLSLIKNAGSDVFVATQQEAPKDNNAFSQMLANVVHDSSILQSNKLPPPPTAVKMDTVTNIDTQPQVVKTEPASDSNAKTETVKNESIISTSPTPSSIKKIMGMKEADGMDMVYTVETNGKKDTIRLFLPISDKKVAVPKAVEPTPQAVIVYEPEKKTNNDTTLTITPTIVKAPDKNIYIKESSKKSSDSVHNEKNIVQPKSTVVVRTPEINNAKENNDHPITESKISENSDCKAFATDNDFLKLRKKMAAENNTDAMITAAKKFFKSRCFTTEQIKNLSFLFLDDEGKYKFFDAAYPFTSDSGQYASLLEQLKDEYYINRFKAMIHK